MTPVEETVSTRGPDTSVSVEPRGAGVALRVGDREVVWSVTHALEHLAEVITAVNHALRGGVQ